MTTLDILLGSSDRGDRRVDLTDAPHLLVAGTTGSGKSVWLNSMLLDLIGLPEERVRLLLIDPKRVELAPYKGLPHVIGDPIHDPMLALISLRWLAEQMEYRFQVLAGRGLRNDDSMSWPKIVVVIDELANVLLAEPEIERPLVKIASMGRAVGIHLVLATQRPDATVLTGLLRANIPSRIAFMTMTAAESRIILDENGAEVLPGKGAMIARIAGTRQERLQGRFVSEDDVDTAIVAAMNAQETLHG